MNSFRKSVVVELDEAPQSDEDRLAEAKQERDSATAAYRAASQNAPDPGRSFRYKTVYGVTYTQTMKPTVAEQASNRAVREADARFHVACRRVAMLENPGLILKE
jgi:hypothetical protein